MELRGHELWNKWSINDIKGAWAHHIEKPFDDKARSEAARWIASNCKSVLDVGCGGAVAGHRFKQLNPKLIYHGIDITKDIIMVANQLTNIPLDSFTVCNIRDLARWHKTFDCVLVSHIIEHHPISELKELVSAIQHVAEKYIVLVLFNFPFDDERGNIENLGPDGFYSNTYNQKFVDELFAPFVVKSKQDYMDGNAGGRPERVIVYERKLP